jgi:hypothetical protein
MQMQTQTRTHDSRGVPLIKVKATQKGHDGEKLIEEGQKFVIAEDLFSATWMVRLDGKSRPVPPPQPEADAEEKSPDRGSDAEAEETTEETTAVI